MKKVNIGTQKYTQIHAIDEPHKINKAHHRYFISPADTNDEDAGEYASVSFQNGPIQEGSVNGCHNEDLLAIVIHRLRGFQSGPYSCRENALALTKLEEAMHWLNHRTQSRIDQNVEGLNIQHDDRI